MFGRRISNNFVVTSMIVDSISHTISLILEKGLRVDKISISVEEAEDIGFIDFDKLKRYTEKF